VRRGAGELAAREPASSSGVKASTVQRTMLTALRCATAIPFGHPVEPEV